MAIDASRFLGAYAGAVTILAGALLIGGASGNVTRFDTIDVNRINVREPDGTLRMVIAGRDRIGGLIIGGKEYPHPNRHEAGMIFYNDEGTENGGLVFDGRQKDGKPTNSGSLTFDRWRQDQTIQMRSIEDGDRKDAGFLVNDRPARPIDMANIDSIRAMPAGPAKDAAYEKAGFNFAERVYLGSRADRASELMLRDAAGRPRLVLRMEAKGDASIRFLDENGKVVRTTTP